MEQFLRSLLIELDHRTVVLRERLTAIDTDEALNAHAIMAYRLLETVHRGITGLLNDPALEAPELLLNHLGHYQRWVECVDLVESIPLPLIERYNRQDRRITRLCQRLALEIRWPRQPPAVAAFSNQYYWTNVGFNFIAVPAAEGLGLLSMPDLCHEMGHILLANYEVDLVGDFDYELAAYIGHEREELARNQRPPKYGPLYERLLRYWATAWKLEFISDMIATYMVGPAYGWQHVRLCTGRSAGVYYPTIADEDFIDHPADEARLYGILAVLRRFGAAEPIEQITALWGQYRQISQQTKPVDYDISYPTSLIESLADRTVLGCRQLGVLSFDQTIRNESSIVYLIHTAWQRFIGRSDGYLEWERQQFADLWKETQSPARLSEDLPSVIATGASTPSAPSRASPSS